MCGLVGILQAGGASLEARLAELRRMNQTLVHRGPDAEGYWRSEDGEAALGHRRLSIVELSEAGAQPMRSGSGRYVIAFNGEIYGHRALRAELERAGHSFRGDSDTEVILAAVEAWGFEGALGRLGGMFALAIWDTRERCLLLARDRMGEKPLFYAHTGGLFLFASELKALLAHPALEPRIDPIAFGRYLRHGYVPAPGAILKGVRKLPPGHLLVIPIAEAGATARPSTPYWSLREVALE
ncbi:MAG: asparagine synthetase B, partial [Myxococcales bacterium]|nr:asparagine synthetase B [Myxococcales bacterium]